jgi:hypothetical protein
MSAAPITDEGFLKKTQGLRNRILDTLTNDGEKIPTDPDSIRLLMEVMADADRTSLSKLKITSDDANASENRLAALTMARLGKHMGSNNPFEVELNPLEHQGEDSRATANSNLLPDIVVVPGNCDIGTSTETFDTFMAKMEPNGPSRAEAPRENYIPDEPSV